MPEDQEKFIHEPRKCTTVNSEGDERIINNIMRHNYRVLNDEEKQAMLAVKDFGLAFHRLLHKIGGTNPDVAEGPLGSRHLSLAGTAIEEAVMWATKHITK